MTCEKSPEDQAWRGVEWKGLYAQNEVGCFVGNLERTRVAEHQFQLRRTKQLPPAARSPERNFSASLRLSVTTRTRYQKPLVPTLDWMTNGWRVSSRFLYVLRSCWNDASAEA